MMRLVDLDKASVDTRRWKVTAASHRDATGQMGMTKMKIQSNRKLAGLYCAHFASRIGSTKRGKAPDGRAAAVVRSYRKEN